MKCPIELCNHELTSGYDMIEHLRIYHTKEIIIRTLTKLVFTDNKEMCHLWIDRKT